MFKCECGREFENSQSFNGHKSHCLVHAAAVGKSVEQVIKEAKQRGCKTSNTYKKKAEAVEQAAKNQWAETAHYCENCGRLMTEKFGSGRFCCRACANSRQLSEETRQKIRSSIQTTVGIGAENLWHINAMQKYTQNSKYCVICGKALPYESRARQTCSKTCKSTLLGLKVKVAVKQHGGNFNNTRNAKYGTYKGIQCDSSYELAYLIYCLDHNISIIRNTQGFQYTYNNQIHTYYPDFIVDGVYVEIKNYWSEQVQAKIDALPESIKYTIIYKDQIKKYINYCKATYGKDFTLLYDRTKSSYLDSK